MSRRERKALKNLKAQRAAEEKLAAEDAKKADKALRRAEAQAQWEASTPQEKQTTTVIIVGILAAVFLICAGCLAFSQNSADDDKAATSTTEAWGPAGETPAETADTTTPDRTETTTEAPTETAPPDLAESVETALLNAAGVQSFLELSPASPGRAITRIETVNSTTVRVYVQENLDRQERAKTGRWVVNMSCEQNPTLDTVVVRDASGVDSNYYKSSNPVWRSCQ